MGLKSEILNKIVKPMENTYYDMVQAEVLSYSEITNKAQIEFQDPRGGGIMVLDNVPVQIGSGGVHSSGPFVGDAVWVNFNNRNPLYPKIIALGDKDYKNNTRERYSHEKQGAYALEQEEVELGEIIPIATAWLNPNKEKSYAYYTNINPIQELREELKDTKYYSSFEVGMTHPQNGSTIKIADDGTISMFTGIGEGIRINPNSHTVTIISGKSVTNEGDVVNNMSNWTINCEDKIMINAKGNISLNTEDYMIFQAKEFVFRDTDGKKVNLQEETA